MVQEICEKVNGKYDNFIKFDTFCKGAEMIAGDLSKQGVKKGMLENGFLYISFSRISAI